MYDEPNLFLRFIVIVTNVYEVCMLRHVFIPWDQWAEIRYLGPEDMLSTSLAYTSVITSV